MRPPVTVILPVADRRTHPEPKSYRVYPTVAELSESLNAINCALRNDDSAKGVDMNDNISEQSKQLELLAERIRFDKAPVDTEVMKTIGGTAHQIREIFEGTRTPKPPREIDDLLWNAGWCIYEASLALVNTVKAAWGITHDATSEESAKKIAELADNARELPWPQFSPRALGAIRCEALVESKLDTPLGYDLAWNSHREAIDKYDGFSQVLQGENKKFIVALDETFIQLGVAEVGTACRQAERVISRWAEGLSEKLWEAKDQATLIQMLFKNLLEGATNGERTLTVVNQVESDHGGFVPRVGKERMTLVTAYRQPGIMTARAWLLLVPLCTEMERWGLPSPSGKPWPQERRDFLRKAEAAFLKVFDTCGLPYSADHQRSLVQLRLNLALLEPGRSMPLVDAPVDCLLLDPMDRSAITAMSDWLEAHEYDANAIGSATMPFYMRSVLAARKGMDTTVIGYREWREAWPRLDRYRKEEGRKERVEKALAELSYERAE